MNTPHDSVAAGTIDGVSGIDRHIFAGAKRITTISRRAGFHPANPAFSDTKTTPPIAQEFYENSCKNHFE